MGKLIIASLLHAAWASAWWAFAMWPEIGAGDNPVGPLIILPLVMTLVACCFWYPVISDNWDLSA